METRDGSGIRCSEHPDAPHGFMRDASHSAGRYVCECEFWEPPKNKPMTRDEWLAWLRESWDEAQGVAASCGKEWVGLTDEEIHDMNGYEEDRRMYRFARAIEAKLKDKNHG